jgi:uncharacterized protein (TIGR04222 family)
MEFVLPLVAVVVAILVRSTAAALTREHNRIRSVSSFGRGDLGHYELAYLAGGPRRVINTAIALLVGRELIRVSRGGQVNAVAGTVPSTEGVEQAVLDLAATPGGRPASEIRHEVAGDPSMTDIKLHLIARGLLLPDGAFSGPREIHSRLSGLVAAAASVMVVSVVVPAAGKLPWSPLAVGAVLVSGLSAVYGLRIHRRYTRMLPSLLTSSGREALQSAQIRNARVSSPSESPPIMSDGVAYAGVASAVALYGLGALGDPTVAEEIEREKQTGAYTGSAGSGGCAPGSCGGGGSDWGSSGHDSGGGHSGGGHSGSDGGGCGGGSSCGGASCGGGGCGGGGN